MSDRSEDFISDLVAAGVLLMMGVGAYRICQAIADYEEGQRVTSQQIKSLFSSQVQNLPAEASKEEERCPSCGTPASCCGGSAANCNICNSD